MLNKLWIQIMGSNYRIYGLIRTAPSITTAPNLYSGIRTVEGYISHGWRGWRGISQTCWWVSTSLTNPRNKT